MEPADRIERLITRRMPLSCVSASTIADDASKPIPAGRRRNRMSCFSHPYLANRRFIGFAHRGGGKENPENTQIAFRAAADLGYSHIELDVQATADGVLVVFHDDNLDRMTTGSGRISHLPYSEVSRAKIAETESIMTLEETLSLFPDLCFNIDIKTAHALQPTIDLVRRMNCLNRICLASFSDKRLAAVRRAFGGHACMSAGPRTVAARKFASWRLPFRGAPVDCVQVPPRRYGIEIVTGRFIRHCQDNNIAVHVWTIDDEAEMRRLIRLGVNGLVTDRPSLLKQVALEEGVWD